jgi:serine/threonine protein kinase
MLRPEHAASPQLVRRFEIEARAASRLRHRGTVALFDYGVTTGGTPYLVMEYDDGPPLSTFLRDRWPLPLSTVVDFGLQILAAIGDAHEAGVIHGDIKTDNILIETRRNGLMRTKIVDYGLARIAEETTEGIFGTPGFTAPEVIAGEPATELADQYSVGATLYEMLSGIPPYYGDTIPEILAMQEREALVAPSQRQPSRGISAVLEAVVLRALAPRPADRFASTTELMAALDLARPPEEEGAPPRCPCGAILARYSPMCPECGERRPTLASTLAMDLAPTQSWRPPSSSPRLARGSEANNRPDQRLDQIRAQIGAAIVKGDVAEIATGYLELAGIVAAFIGHPAAARELEEGIDVITGGEGASSRRAPAHLWRMLLDLARYYHSAGDRMRARIMGGYARFHAIAVRDVEGEELAKTLLDNLRAESRQAVR